MAQPTAGLIQLKPPACGALHTGEMFRYTLLLICLTMVLAIAGRAGIAASADPVPVQREIIPGSELMTTQERERYRLRLRGAGTPQERERLRAEHVRAIEERAQMRGLQLIDYSRLKGAP